MFLAFLWINWRPKCFTLLENLESSPSQHANWLHQLNLLCTVLHMQITGFGLYLKMLKHIIK